MNYQNRVQLLRFNQNIRTQRIVTKGIVTKIDLYGVNNRKIKYHFQDQTDHDFILYYYRKDSYNSDFVEFNNLSLYIKDLQITVSIPPSPPHNLTGFYENNTLNLEWEAPLSNGDGTLKKYEIYRMPILSYKDNNPQLGLYILLGTNNPNNRTFQDQPGLDYDYMYFIVAYNEVGESERSKVLIHKKVDHSIIIEENYIFGSDSMDCECQIMYMEEL